MSAGRACSRRLQKRKMLEADTGNLFRHRRKQQGFEKERQASRMQHLPACLPLEFACRKSRSADGACRAVRQKKYTRHGAKRTNTATLHSSDRQKLRTKKLPAAVDTRFFQIICSPADRLKLSATPGQTKAAHAKSLTELKAP